MSLHSVTASLFSDISFVLQRLTPQEYAQPLEVLSNASLGQHTRHILEFFQCLMEQVGKGTIDYDVRQRNKDIEQNPLYAASVMEDLQAQMEKVDVQLPLLLIANYSGDVQNEAVNTTFGRELVYNIEHCIHHLAIIRIGLKCLKPGLTLPPQFGVAPSTVKYWNRQKANAHA
ncbi:MAG: hypothetical protein AAF135_24570 [Bacteroidota bacterium]